MKKKYQAIIVDLDISIPIDGAEMCTFITHFGKFGNIEIFDKQKEEMILNTVGTMINKFYPDVMNRELAYRRSKHLFHYFEDYKHQRIRKYPQGELKKIYNELVQNIDQKKQSITIE